MKKLSSISAVFPAFNDERTIGQLVRKIAKLLPSIAKNYEIIVVNDGSSDGTAKVLDNLRKKVPALRVITHESNKGYGATLIDGFRSVSQELIFYTDGDGQYDVSELTKLVALFDVNTDIVTGYKMRRSDSWTRKFVGFCYNQMVRRTFGLHVRDVDCDFRLFRRSLLRGISLEVTSGAFDVEFIKKLQRKKARFKEVGVSHYKRKYGNSQFFNIANVLKSVRDLGLLCFSLLLYTKTHEDQIPQLEKSEKSY